MKKIGIMLLSVMSMTLMASVAPLQITSMVIEPAGCNVTGNGSLTVTVTGGQLPHTFTLEGPVSAGPITPAGNTVTFSDLPPGNYVIRVQDVRPSGGITQAQIQTGSLVSSIAITPVSCFDNDTGAISILAQGGASPISYTLNSSGLVPPIAEQNNTGIFTDLPADLYSLSVVDASGCGATIPQIVITQPTQLEGDAVVTSSAHCPVGPGGRIEFIPTSIFGDFGGVPPYQFTIDGGKTFQESPIFNNVSAGVYVVLLKDSFGCETTSEELFVPSEFQASGDPVTDFVNLKYCDGCFPKASV